MRKKKRYSSYYKRLKEENEKQVNFSMDLNSLGNCLEMCLKDFGTSLRKKLESAFPTTF